MIINFENAASHRYAVQMLSVYEWQIRNDWTFISCSFPKMT